MPIQVFFFVSSTIDIKNLFCIFPPTRHPFWPRRRRVGLCGAALASSMPTNNAEAVSRSLPPPSALRRRARKFGERARVEIFARLPPSSVQQRCYSRQHREEFQSTTLCFNVNISIALILECG